MSAQMLTDLDDELIEQLAPHDAPDDDTIQAWDTDLDGATEAEHVLAWRPTDVGAADWVARKAVRAKDAVASLQAQRDRIVQQADAWLAHERARHDRTQAWAEQMLAVWLTAEIEQDDSKKPKKSRSLPAGVTVKQTAGRGSLEVADPDLMAEWLKTHRPDLVEEQIRFVWSKADAKKLADADGRIAVVDEDTGEVEVAPAQVVTGPARVTVAYGGGA